MCFTISLQIYTKDNLFAHGSSTVSAESLQRNYKILVMFLLQSVELFKKNML